MEDVFVTELVSTTLYTVTPDTLVENAAQLILDSNISSVIVVDESSRPEDTLTTIDFVSIAAKSQPRTQAAVEWYMATNMITAGAQDSILSVAELMAEHGFHHIPVADEEEGVIGVIAASDLAAYPSQTGQLARSQRRHFQLTSALLHLLGEALDCTR